MSTWPPPAPPPVSPRLAQDSLDGADLDALRATEAGRKAIDIILAQHFALRDARELAERYKTEASVLATRLENPHR